jgi:hypothetical protein
MPSDYEILFHRSFLNLEMAKAIWNEDYIYQNARGGRDRQRRCESDPVYAYHVEQGPHYPAKPPGDTPDKTYAALVSGNDGNLRLLVIITKRGLSGQNFPLVATQWERTNSVLCGAFKFYPVLNAMMEVKAHCANIWASQLIRPAGLSTPNGPISPEECIANEIPLYLWIKPMFIGDSSMFIGASSNIGAPFENRHWENFAAPKGWESFNGPEYEHRGRSYRGGIDVLVLPNGKVIGAVGKPFSRNNGTTYSTMSPLDFWTPGSGLLAGGIRTLSNRLTAAALRGLDAIIAATAKDLTLLSAREFALSAAGVTMRGMAVSARGMTYAVEHVAGRTFILGEDMALMRSFMNSIPTEAGFYDLFIHGEPKGFSVLIKTEAKNVEGLRALQVADAVRTKLPPGFSVVINKEANAVQVWKDLSVREVADAVRTKLPPGVKLRLLSCDTGLEGQGVAQELANELNRTVWGADGTLYPQQVGTLAGGRPYADDFEPTLVGARPMFVPEWGKLPDGSTIRGAFREFRPQRGSAALKSNGGKVPTNEASGEINRVHPRPPGPGR